MTVLVGRNLCATFQFIVDRVWKKLLGWKEKLLSQVGKKVWLKSVIQQIPTRKTIMAGAANVGIFGCSSIKSKILLMFFLF